MTKPLNINSDAYWDGRFKDDWETCEGPQQSRFFARLAIENLPWWLIEQIRRHSLTLADWGCAQGDGTDVWASHVDPQRLVGVDFSGVAIEQAATRYPAIRFVNENWLSEKTGEIEPFDIVFSSNTLEHFHRPWDVLTALTTRAKKAVILALPYRELERTNEHFYSFLPNNVPIELSNGFRLVWSRVIDCRPIPSTLWDGDQVFLVYADQSWVDSFKLTLADCEFGRDDTASTIASLNQEVAARDGQIASLNQEVTARDGQIVRLNQEVTARDGQIASLNQEVTARDGQITTLNEEVTARDGQIATLNQEVTARDRQIATLNQEATARVGKMADLNQKVTAREGQIASLNQEVTARDGQIVSLNQEVTARDEQIASLNQEATARDGQITSLNQEVTARDGQITTLNQEVTARDRQIASLNQAVGERDGQISNLRQIVAERDSQLVSLRNEADSLFNRLEELFQTRSWQLTRPLRGAARIIRHGHPFADGSRGIYDMAARIGRTFPFPLWMKVRVRAALIEKIYPTVQSAPASRCEANGPPLQVFDHPNAYRASMRPECCGLIEGLVSVVLPVYNQANLIAESIESVLRQTYQNFELIIINDGSADGVETALERYLDHPKVRCFTQANQGLPKALSNGFSYARGEFWTWTSADNMMEPRMLEMLVDKLRAEPELGMTFADYYAIDDRGHLLQDQTWREHNRPDPSSGEIRLPHTTEALNSVQDNFIGPCFMYRGWIGRCLADYDPQLGVEDYDYWMRINAFFPIRHLGDRSLLYRYRVHDNTLSAQAREHGILEKAQRLMDYEKERAEFYASSMAYVADASGFAWLQAKGVSYTDIYAFEGDIDTNALVVISSETAEKHISGLLRSRQPAAVIANRQDTRYHKLLRLFTSGHCVVLAEDRDSAARVRLLSSSCPVIDAKSGIALAAMRAFAKNLLFVRATRSAEELKRNMPHRILAPRNHHVVLQVDSFTQGGMENVIIDLGLSLKTNGYRVTIANFGKAGDASDKAKKRGLESVSLSCDMSDEAYRSWLLEHKVDLVNAHYSVRGAAACRDAGVPFIQTTHNSYVWLDPIQIDKYREADCHTTNYMCVSMTAARYADVVLGLDVSKMKVVPNGIDPSAIDAANFARNRASLRSAWGVGAQEPIFLNVASIMAPKAQLPLVKAFVRVVEKAPEARLILLGAVMEVPYQAAIEKAIHELGLQKNVLIVGYDREVARYYHASDVFVLPSYWEGWSLSLGEAMANGLACVITDVGSAYEFEGLSNVEIVDPPFGDITALNYRNAGDFVYGEDASFESRLADAMTNVVNLPRATVNIPLAEQLDRDLAYRAYAEDFNDMIKEGAR